jgi:hypothetical protein
MAARSWGRRAGRFQEIRFWLPLSDHSQADCAACRAGVPSASATCRATARACARSSGTAVHSQRTPRTIGPRAWMRGLGRPFSSSRLSEAFTSRPRPRLSSRPRPRPRSAPSNLSGDAAAVAAPVASNTRNARVSIRTAQPRERQVTRTPPSHGSTDRIVPAWTRSVPASCSAATASAAGAGIRCRQTSHHGRKCRRKR